LTGYAWRRLFQAIPTLVGATLLGFALIHLAPDDPIQFYAAQSGGMTSDDIERLRHLYGLDLPLAVQYVNWLSQLVRLDFGVSFASHQPVLQMIGERLPATLTLTLTALIMSTILGVTILGGYLPNPFGGSVVVESVFSWPGIGRMAVDADFARDYPLLMGPLLMLAALVAVGNLLSDLAYGVVDPRIKLS
jgi:ABC-type dipeptide/oligopeptide/nickel transport system permease component